MSLAELARKHPAVTLLQRSLFRRRLGHAYLLSGDRIDDLELLAGEFARLLNCPACDNPATPDDLTPCGECESCRKIANANHPDVRWLRPESKLRLIRIEQIRNLMEAVNLKANSARYKVAVLVAADRLNDQAANAFLKTLEEPPPRTIFLLLTTEPQRMLETIQSRCLRLHCGTGAGREPDAAELEWLTRFATHAGETKSGLFNRYLLLDHVLQRLAELKSDLETRLKERSPLEHHTEIDPKLADKWKDELSAAIEAEYRHQRTGLLALVQLWLRDVWLCAGDLATDDLLALPDLRDLTSDIAGRLRPEAAAENLAVIEQTMSLLHTNVQEALALEIGLLKLRFN